MPQRNEADLLALIAAQQEEHQQLEFKSAGALVKTDGAKAEISKDVSALANAIGGTIVYGIAEDSSSPPSRAASLDPIDPAVFSKEWLESVINSRIQPRVSGVRISPIQLPTKSPGCVAYVVDIPESDTAHQASDKRYYKRLNFQVAMMEDYEIRQTMFRASKPSYKIIPRAVSTQGPSNQMELHFSATVINLSAISGQHCSLIAYLPTYMWSADIPEHDVVTVDGHVCRRLLGQHEMRLPPGPTVLEIAGNLSVSMGPNSNPKEETEIFFRIYDSFGLALHEQYVLNPRSKQFRLERFLETGRRPSAVLP